VHCLTFLVYPYMQFKKVMGIPWQRRSAWVNKHLSFQVEHKAVTIVWHQSLLTQDFWKGSAWISMKITLSHLVDFVKNSDRISTQGFTECLNNKSRASGNVSTLCSRILALSRTPPREVPWNRQSKAWEAETFRSHSCLPTVVSNRTQHRSYNTHWRG